MCRYFWLNFALIIVETLENSSNNNNIQQMLIPKTHKQRINFNWKHADQRREIGKRREGESEGK